MEELDLLKVLASFAFVIALILLLSWAMRHFRGHRWVEKVQGARRLQCLEQLYLDSKNKLVLVKCDDKEHLILVGTQGSSQIAELSK